MAVIAAHNVQIDPVGDQIDLLELFDNDIPNSVNSLLYNLHRLDDDLDSALYGTIGVVYKAFVEDVGDEQREKVFRSVLEEIEVSELDPTTILAFIRFEPNHPLVCSAVWSYLKNRVVSFKNPFVATQHIVSVLTEHDVVNRGAVYAGLVCFGDRRVCAVARTIRDSISPAEARAFATAVTSPLNRTTIVFCIEWVVKLVNRNQFEAAIPIVLALSAMIVRDSTLDVRDTEYNFGPFGFSSFINHPGIEFQDLLLELMPILDTLSALEKPAVDQMIEIFMDPSSSSLEQLKWRKDASQRKSTNRRASDRRIVDITLHINRRALQRRGEERRLGIRR